MGWGHSSSNLLIVYKHFRIEGPSMSLPTNYNHQTYQSDLPVLYMVKIFNRDVPLILIGKTS